jgi:predicted alpha/beta superfamily hydrolase
MSAASFPSVAENSRKALRLSADCAKGIIPMVGRTVFLLVCALALGRASTDAQSPSLPLPVRVDTLISAKVGEPREFWVSLPDRYNTSTEKYPVLVMMDGDSNFNSGVIGGVRQAAWSGEIPEFIIVGIKNTNRSKDIFPEEVTYPDGTKDGGRANQYLDFVRDELIPHIAKTYRTDDYRVLYGTSNTGFTAVYGLFRSPDLANAYIATSATLAVPSFRSARDNLVGSFTGGRRALVLVMGEHDYPTVVSLNGALKETISMRAPAGLTCRLRVIENGEHVPSDALVEGLRTLFQGWKITRPLTEGTFAEIRAQVDRRLEQFGLAGKIDEEILEGLGESLLGEKKIATALEVLAYRATSYPQSADGQVALGDGYRQSGNLDKARECYRRALAMAPGHAAATAKLKEVERPVHQVVRPPDAHLRLPGQAQ